MTHAFRFLFDGMPQKLLIARNFWETIFQHKCFQSILKNISAFDSDVNPNILIDLIAIWISKPEANFIGLMTPSHERPISTFREYYETNWKNHLMVDSRRKSDSLITFNSYRTQVWSTKVKTLQDLETSKKEFLRKSFVHITSNQKNEKEKQELISQDFAALSEFMSEQWRTFSAELVRERAIWQSTVPNQSKELGNLGQTNNHRLY
jgi:hypothetical protein